MIHSGLDSLDTLYSNIRGYPPYQSLIRITKDKLTFYKYGHSRTMHSYKCQSTDETVDKAELVVNIYSDMETDFRERYSNYLRTMKQRIYDTYLGYNELEDERKFVNQQAMKTPGRRGEIIKSEEIDKEFSRRYSEHQKSSELL